MKRKRKTKKQVGSAGGGDVGCVPQYIKIGYADFEIVGLTHDQAALRDPAGICGQIHPDKHIIDYDESLNQVALANTLLHECMHGIVDMQGLTFRREEEEENIVNALANGMSALIRDNPDFIKFLVKSLR